MKKNYSLLLILLSPVLLFPGCCCEKETCTYPMIQTEDGCDCIMDPAYMNNAMNATINNNGSSQQEESHDPTVSFSNDSTEIDASFSGDQWLWFRIGSQNTGTFNLANNGNMSIYNSNTNTEYIAVDGYISFSSLNVADKKLAGTFDDMKLVSPTGDTVLITNGSFVIDN